jgi:hypothetical protein
MKAEALFLAANLCAVAVLVTTAILLGNAFTFFIAGFCANSSLDLTIRLIRTHGRRHL